MIMIGLIVFGAMSFSKMGMSRLPDVDFPVLSITVTWTGAAPEIMESTVADVIEESIMSVEGIRSVSTQVQEGRSTTSIEFELKTNINNAFQDVQAKLMQAQRSLPNDIDPPIITKSNPEDQPILWAALTGPNSLRDKVLFVRDHLKDAITTTAGVGDLRLGGYVDPNMRISLNTKAMRSREIAVTDVIGALTSGNVLAPSGYIEAGERETSLRVMSEASTEEQFRNLVIPSRSGAPIFKPIKVGEVATVKEDLADIRRISRLNGESAIGLGVIKQRGSNAVAVGDGVKDKIKEILPALPQGMKLQTTVDTTRFIKESTHELLFTLTLASLLTSIVCFLFLGSWGSAFNVILAIPTSLIGSFIILNALGFTINTFTLLALSLSIGIVVDDAIMVLENISRHFENGMSRVRAAMVGAREITGAAIAATLAILAIFLPVVFMDGIVGKFFFQFGIAMSVAVTLSLIEALTLAPMRCSQFLAKGTDTKLGHFMNRHLDGLAIRYGKMLVWCLGHRWKILIASIALFAGSLYLAQGARKEFVPPQDQSQFLATIYTPIGSSLDFTDNVFRELEKLLKTRGEVDVFYSAVGGFQGGVVNTGNLFVVMKPPKERAIQEPFNHRPTQQEFIGWARDNFKKIKGVQRAIIMDLSIQGFTANRGLPVTFSIQGPDWAELARQSEAIQKKMAESGLMTDIDDDYKANMPEVKIIPDRVKAVTRGVTVENIASTVSALVGSLRVGKYTDTSGHRNDVRVKLLDEYNQRPDDIRAISVRNLHGEMVPLGQLVDLKQQTSLLTISRYNRERAITVVANLAPGKSQSDAIEFTRRTSEELLPPGYRTVFSGGSQAFQESFRSLMIALVLGIFVAYMVLGAQFNSFIHPVSVLLALPFSITGALIALRLTDVSLNIYSMIGILLLMGIVKKNSILLVDFTNQRREAGSGPTQALLEACPLRLRPILMTSIATIAAAIPAAIALGPGAETIRPMAVVVIGGVLLSTVLTLFVVPCAYSLLVRLEGTKHREALKEALAES